MSTVDMIIMAAKNLWKRKLRTMLTVLGVVIGTASIVVMMSIGIGLNKSYRQELEQWGSLQVIEVYNYNWDNSGGDVSLDDKTVQTFKDMEHVEAVTPAVEISLMLVDNKRYVSDISVRGMDPSAMEAFGYKVSEGRILEPGDKNQIVLGAYTVENFRNPKLSWRASMNAGPPEVDVFNDKMTLTWDYSYGTKYADSSIKPIKVEVVGVMDGSGQDAYYSVMPLDQVMKLKDDKEKQERRSNGGRSYGGSQKSDKYSCIFVKADSTDSVIEVQNAIKDMGYTAYSLADNLEYINNMTNMIQMVLGAIGAVSLLVAAIGIANTMIMAIYERTKEIGIMKVIGAAVTDIEKLFLTEAAFIGFLGGVAGVILSYIVSLIVNYVVIMSGQSQYNISSIPPWLALLALAFATLVGILAGYLPAKRAMKLSALTAIRTE